LKERYTFGVARGILVHGLEQGVLSQGSYTGGGNLAQAESINESNVYRSRSWTKVPLVLLN